jgi:N-carbamoylputrescine amidase
MPRNTRIALIQTSAPTSDISDLSAVKAATIAKHLPLIAQAADRGANVCCLQELFFSPYFAAEQNPRWFQLAEPIPSGPTIQLMQELARKHGMVIIAPIFEMEAPGIYYNSAAIIDESGRYLGKYRKKHIPHLHPGFWEKFYFKPGNSEGEGGGYPVFQTKYGRIGIYICYDRHYPEGARELGLNGAEIVFNPSATVAGLSEYLWKLEQPAHAVANQYFVAAINRVGTEAPWNIGEFYGQSYVCDPRGQIVNIASRDKDEVLITDIDLDLISQVRTTWQFYRDRRPETYTNIATV